MNHFGEHVTIDGYGGDASLLDDKDLVLKFLEKLPVVLGMTVLLGPQMVHAPGNGKKDPGGWSGFVIIAESHISIHTFPKKCFLSADVYTCKNGIDIEQIKKLFVEAFKLREVELNFIKRGLKYSSNL